MIALAMPHEPRRLDGAGSRVRAHSLDRYSFNPYPAAAQFPCPHARGIRAMLQRDGGGPASLTRAYPRRAAPVADTSGGATEAPGMTESVSFDLCGSLAPSDVWLRSPLKRERLARVLAAPGLPFASGMDGEPLMLTAAKLLDMAIPHVLFWSKPANQAKIGDYMAAVIALAQASNAMLLHSNAPPPIPPSWLRETQAWVQEAHEKAPSAGRLPEDGHERFFSPMAAFYKLAYGRRPAATPDGPTQRFFRCLWEELRSAIRSHGWPPINDRGLLARISAARDTPPDQPGEFWLAPADLYVAFRDAPRGPLAH